MVSSNCARNRDRAGAFLSLAICATLHRVATLVLSYKSVQWMCQLIDGVGIGGAQ